MYNIRAFYVSLFSAFSHYQSDVAPLLPVSIATVEINGTTVQVQYTNTVWAVGESCLACSRSSNAEVGPCPLWPSCDSLKLHWAQNESKLGKFQPVYLQIKPEYLGDWGCEVLSPFELAQAWLGSMLRDKADIVRVRVCADSGELVWLEYQSYDELLLSHPDLK
ncbi:hypothetical protein FBUS_10077 [Fasciolopsis buskii]|uniref:Little elongation complex subunit 2 C-terminal domain-containing protein n=1 Tax=Fasciolopsis buskii TaxID=27845 RepID=A0A8E0RVW5_9TREM|nr:hypothetical protein FBUS_10077 [Fasciolopsis buski]